MENNVTKTVVTTLLVVFVVIPTVLTVVSYAIGGIIIAAENAANKKEFDKKIKEGLKNGTIIEHDGNYYNVEVI